MKILQRTLTGALAAVILLTAVSPAAKAAAPTVTVDEAVYANLDYYGKTQKINVVKGCDLNGNSTFTDYGSYGQVTNMTNEAAPKVQGDSVTWSLPVSTGRFYYECTPSSGQISLPWSFDVSYKLNGVPTDAKKLAGASGLVEINIKATPNKNVGDYMKNNMLLQVGTAVKMKDTLSVEAPGAQLQSLGDYKAVLFAGLPGEEKTFTIRIGTKSFESDGIVMMMVPGTLEQFKNIRDLSKDKDTLKSSVDAVNVGTNQILNSIESLSSGLSQTKSGLAALDGARGSISSSKGQVYKNADAALTDLSALTKQTAALVPHLQKSEQLVDEVNTNMNTMVQTISSASASIYTLSDHISALKSNVSDLRDVSNNLDDLSDSRKGLTGDLKSNLATVGGDLAALDSMKLGDKLNAVSGELKSSLDQLSKVLGQVASAAQQAAMAAAQAGDMASAQSYGATAKMAANAAKSLDSINGLITISNAATGALKQMSGQSASLLKTGNELVSVTDSYFDTLEDGHDATDKLLKNANRIGSDAQSLLGISNSLIGNMTDLNTTMNKYKDGTISALKDTEALAGGLTEGLNSSHAFLTSLETLMETSGSKLDSGTRQSLNGLISVLQQSMNGIGKTSVVRNAGNTIRSTVDTELDKLGNDSNVLNLDPEAKPMSFTSSKNPAPSSTQVVLRTEEISIDDDHTDTKDLEKEPENPGPLVRIQSVFVKLWNDICSLFSK